MIKSKLMFLLFCLICFAGSVSSSQAAKYDFFGRFIPQRTPVIDGVLTPGEWSEKAHITLYKFFGEDSKIEIYLSWDSSYLYLGADVEDYELWVDNYLAAIPWLSTWDDDAFKWEIDPDLSRDTVVQSGDRIFAINADGSASRFDRGDGLGNTVGATIFETINKVVAYKGTMNDYSWSDITAESRKDGGYTLEVALSWHNIFGDQTAGAPVDGDSMGMNFTIIEDDTGSTLDPEYYEQYKRVADEITRYMGEEGIPENWAEFVFSATGDNVLPGAVTALSSADTGSFATTISFNASGDNGTNGYAEFYDIRYSTSALTESNWTSATVFKNNFRPQKSGSQESFRIIGLSPATTYYLGVKAVDEQGNVSPLTSTNFTTTAASTPTDKGFLTVDPGKRYLSWENGEPLIVIGDNQGMSWPYINHLYTGTNVETTSSYLQDLSNHGVNTIRIMFEDMEIDPPLYLFSSLAGGPNNITFNNQTISFIQSFLDECAKYSINVVAVPFDTFFYQSNWSKSPFNVAMGGPMSSPSDFFNKANRDYLKAILAKLVEIIGDRKNLLAWEIINEFDSDDPDKGWNRASFSAREETVNELADYIRSIDSNHLVYISSVRWDPKFSDHLTQDDESSIVGADAALVLNNRHLDLSSTHMYYHDIRDPNLNDPDNCSLSANGIVDYKVADLDNTIAPAQRIKQGLQFYYANTLTPKPYFDTEAGPIKFYITEYDQYFSESLDYQFFHNMIWSHLASGEVGTGLRWPGEMLESQDHALPDQMRKYQLALKNFIADNLDFSGFQPVQIGEYLAVSGTGIPIVKTGITDGNQGIIFLVNDRRRQLNSTVSSAKLTVPKLAPHGQFTFEFWDSYDETKTTADSTCSVTADGQGNAVVSLPDFTETQAVKFYRTDSNGPVNGYMVTDDLWIRAVIHTEDKGAVDGVWYKGGEDTTASGDKVIWGYFYADPGDESWGSANNPDLFVKIWFDAGGRVDVNFFHVSVPDIEVFSNYPYNGGMSNNSTTTMTRRYIRHYYQDGLRNYSQQDEDGNDPAAFTFSANPAGYSTINNLRIGAVINTVDGPIDGVWRQGGSDTTANGDQVVWGHFYASPNDVTWGSPNNPDLFVKIWFDAGGRVDVNFFHVSVPDIEVFSDLPSDGNYDQKGTTTMDNRYIRHTY